MDGYTIPRPRAWRFNFGDFVMLRVLTLQGLIPSASSLANLKQLQTLDLRRGHIIWITSDAVKTLHLLKHLYLSEYSGDFVGGLGDFVKKRKLRLDGLKNLEILEGFNSKTCDSKSLSTLINLRTITATVMGNLKDLGDFITSVINLTSLQSSVLDVKLRDLLPMDMVREMFSWSSLTVLKLSSLMKELPEYEVGFGQNLYRLSLSNCRMDKDPLTTLEKLPNLRTLSLDDESYEGKELVCHAMGFPKLISLYIHNLNNLEKWEIEDGAMPLLSHLEIEECKQLKMIPEGLISITSLTKLVISDMPKEFKERLRVNDNGEEGDEFYKIRHVVSAII